MIDRRFASPRILFGVVWFGVVVGALIGPKGRLFLKYGERVELFPPMGVVWFVAAVVAFYAGTFMTRYYQLEVRTRGLVGTGSGSYYRSYPFVAVLTTGIALFLLVWTYVAARQVGGVQAFLELMQRDWQATRELWPRQKPFPGGRLLYTGLIACSIYAFTLLGDLRSRPTGTGDRLRVMTLAGVSLLPLCLLPILVSQRILVAAALFGSGTAYVISKRDGVNPTFVLLIGVVGFGVWTAQEAVRTGRMTLLPALTHSLDLLFYYFQVGLTNTTRGAAFMTERGYGLLSFSFVFDYLFVSDQVKQLFLTEYGAQAARTKAVGPWPPLVMPYLDFGWLGLIVIAGWGYAAQLTYDRSADSPFWSQIYALVAATILVSFHQQFWSNPAFWFNIGLLALFRQVAIRI